MIAATTALHFAVAISMALATVDASACAADDLHCSALALASSARRARSDAERVEYLYFANRAYLALSETSLKGPVLSRDLCQAKQLIEQAAALPATELRARVIKSRKETRTKLKREKVRCKQTKQQANDDRPRVALAGSQAESEEPAKLLTRTPAPEASPTPEAEGPDRTQTLSPGMSAPPTTTTTNAELRAHETWTTPIREAAPSPIREAAPSGSTPGRRLLISGGLSLAAGLGLVGIAGYTGTRAVIARRTGFTGAELAASPDNMDRDAALRADYEHRGTVAVATGITGGAALVAAIVMLCVGARRKARAADGEPRLMPIRAGLLFTGRF